MERRSPTTRRTTPMPGAVRRVNVEYVVVGGRDGEALARCQADAIRAVLHWTAGQNQPGTP